MSIKKHQVKSKLAVAYQLMHTPEVEGHIPETELLYENSFKRMMKKHGKVYIKPDRGRKSRGVMQVERLKDNRFKIRQGSDMEYVDSHELWTKIKDLTRDKRYLIQQAIDSVTKDRRHFDLRCHVLRINGKWKIGGICGRLGKRGSVVTTSHAGGTPTLIKTLFTRHLRYSRRETSDMIQKVEKCVVKTVNNVSRMYPNLKEYAVDIGIDPKKRIWIYEVNIEPLIRGNFKLLPDKTLYRRIRYMRKTAK
jgi:glutathione synthase/RimK-type ligase-like ATP-grasp enzyme